MAIFPIVIVSLLINLLQPSLTLAFKTENGGCIIPSTWIGEWHQASFREPISITEETITSKGRCIEALGDKAVFFEKSDGCYRCLVFHERHPNILQYKESPCVHKEPIGDMCTRVTADAYLYSMIRIDAKPVTCPLPAPSTFTYSTGKGDCRYPLSSVERCSDPYKKLVRYQACPDVLGAESSEEELTCIATWKEGTSRYLMARLRTRHHAHGHHAERYRCYLIERDRASLKMAQSGDASCNGLFSTSEGARTYVFNPDVQNPLLLPVRGDDNVLPCQVSAQPLCQFPPWLTRLGMKWSSLDYKSSIEISNSDPKPPSFMEDSYWSSSLTDTSQAWYRRITRRIEESPLVKKEVPVASARHQFLGSELKVWNLTLNPMAMYFSGKHTDIRLSCYQQYDDLNDFSSGVATYVAEILDGCHNGYTCMELRKRSEYIMELSLGSPARRPEDACLPPYFTESQIKSVTYVASSIPATSCPNSGKHIVTWQHRDLGFDQGSSCTEQGVQSFEVGCRSSEMVDMKGNCNLISRASDDFTCHSGWIDENGEYIILTPTRRSSRGSKRFCVAMNSRTPPPITLRDGRVRQEPTRVSWTLSSTACVQPDQISESVAAAFNSTIISQCHRSNSRAFHPSSLLPVLIILIIPFLR